MAKVPNAAEILPKIWTIWVGRTNVTDSQTTDDRQTDGRTTAYSEREREFTFANNCVSTGTVHIYRHQILIIGPLPTFPSKFHANPFGSFWAKLLTDKQADKQTNNDENITSLAEVTTNQNDFFFRYAILRGGAVAQRVRHLGLRSVRRGFKSCSKQRCVTALSKLFTPMCLCHQAV